MNDNMAAKKTRPVVVFNSYRNIVFGYVVKDLDEHGRIKLTGARICYSYVAPGGENNGPGGLGTVGPQKGSKVGPRVTVTICNVANVVECNPASVAAWEAAGWEE